MGPIFNFFKCTSEFITQEVYFLAVMRIYVGLIMLAAYFCHSRSSQVEQLFIDKNGLACSLYCTKSGRRCIGRLPLVKSSSQWEAKGRYLKKGLKPRWPIRSKET